MMDHPSRIAILTPIPNKTAETVARVIIDRLTSIFGPPETLHSDQGTEFENKIIYQLQTILGYKKTRMTQYRPQGNSVSERVHATMHAMLAMHSSMDCDNWADRLPMVQLAYNTSFNTTMHETPFTSTGRCNLRASACGNGHRYREIVSKHKRQSTHCSRTSTPEVKRTGRESSNKKSEIAAVPCV